MGLLDGFGYPLIADMGLAKIVVGKTYTVCGTADYMAPETLRRTGHNRGVDWWAFGILIFVMSSGQSPFDANEAAQIYKNVVKGLKKEHYPKDFDKDLKEVIGNLCRKKPEERLPMGQRGLLHLQEAPWYSSFDWESMVARRLQAPHSPPSTTLEELQRRTVETPPFVQHVEDLSDWDAAF